VRIDKVTPRSGAMVTPGQVRVRIDKVTLGQVRVRISWPGTGVRIDNSQVSLGTRLKRNIS